MCFTQWIRGMCYSGYDRRGNAKYLVGRDTDPALCDVDGVPATARDEALALLCDSFDIPERQMYCLRRDDALMAIYQSFVGPRSGDDTEFERLWMALDELPGGNLSSDGFEAIRTVEDVIRTVAKRRGMSGQCGGSRPQV
jgi:hypothetical protein